MAAGDYFLKIDGIQGKSRDDRHKDEIDIESFSWGETQSGTFAGGGGRGSRQSLNAGFPFHHASEQSEPGTLSGVRARRSHQKCDTNLPKSW